MKKLLFIILFITFTLTLSALDYDFIPLQGVTKEIKTDNFVVIFPEHLKERGERTAFYAEDIYAKLSPFLEWKPFLRTVIVLTDHTDIPNGMAIPIFRNSIILYATPANSEVTMEEQHDPLYSLLVHEMTHVLQLDQIRGAAYFWRVFYGKLYFPVVNSFRWYQEGTAILAETKFAEGGRLESSYNRAIINRMALNGTIPSFDRLMLPVVDWPHGNSTYHLGARFVEYIYNEYGEERFKELYIDLSNDFWPFVFLFVMKFEKVYGKKLRVLWNEWKAFEEAEALRNRKVVPMAEQLTLLEGRMSAMAERDGVLYLGSSSYKNDRYLYKYDGELSKIKLGRFKSILPTADPDIILYTQITGYPRGLELYDIYSYNLKTGVERRLTKKGRVYYLAGGLDERFYYVKNGVAGAELYATSLVEGKIEEAVRLEIGDFDFIGQPRLDESGERLLFSGRMRGQGDRLYVYELSANVLTTLSGVEGRRPGWINGETISFLAPHNGTDCLFSYSLADGTVTKVLESNGTILKAIIKEDNIYYIDYTAHGEELFRADYNPGLGEATESLFAPTAGEESGTYVHDLVPSTYKVKNYNRMRYIWPPVWAFVPYIMNTQVLLDIPVFNNIPVVGPQLQIYNRLPLGRFNYMLTVALDYMKWYPENSLALQWNLGFMDINYSWKNWAGGSNIHYFYREQWYHLTAKYPDRYPISFSNALQIGFKVPLLNYGNLGLGAQVYHRFDEYNLTAKRLTNTMQFSQYLSYSFTRSRVKASRWDRGFSFGVSAIQSPGGLLDNVPYYTLRGNVEGRLPVGSAFLFIKGSGGGELLGQNVFTVSTESFVIGQSIVGGSSSGGLMVDTKAFSNRVIGQPFKGSAYGAADIGFDITLYKRSHYWHFATLGFKELYIRPYVELVYLYNNTWAQPQAFLFDAAFEVCVDLFAVYGNLAFNVVSGLAVGYKTGETTPAFNYYFAFNVGL